MEARLAAYRADKQKEQSLLAKFSPTKLFLRKEKKEPLSSEKNITDGLNTRHLKDEILLSLILGYSLFIGIFEGLVSKFSLITTLILYWHVGRVVDKSIGKENITHDSGKQTLKERQPEKINTVLDANLPTDENKKTTHSWLTYLNLCLKIVLWLLLWAYFIQVEFGSVFFVFSLFYLLYKGTRTGPIEKKLSAYSVFNPNFETLEGTFTAEQFEKELKYGAGSVR